MIPAPEQFPEELRNVKRIIGYRLEFDESKQKFKKPPASPVTGENIGATKKYLEHLLVYDEALSGIKKFGLDGPGYVFIKEDDWFGVDFDGSEKDGVTHPEVFNWSKWFPSFTEISISGTGRHVICKGKLFKALAATPLPNAPGVTVEIYNDGRYFTLSGQRVGDINEIVDCQVGLEKLLAHLGAKKVTEQVSDGEIQRAMSVLSARKIHEINLEALKNAAQGEGNARLNQCAFFAGKAFVADALEGTEESIKKQLLEIVLGWAKPHPEHGAKETIRSGWTSGAAQPLAICGDEFPQVTETINEFNKGFFLVKKFGNRARVCSLDLNRIARGTSYILAAQSVADFKVGWMNKLIQTGVKEDGNPKFEDKATAWLRHKHRREYNYVVFEPNRETPRDIYNLWRGFAYEPKKGDCSRYLAHLRDNICQNDPVKYDYLIGWMAYAVRYPGEQGHVAIVVQGLKGVGKNVFAEGFANLWGQHGLVVSDQSRITKNFNAHLRDKCVLVCDEAFFAGDRRHEGVLKALITGNTITIEAKGVDVEAVPNLLHLIIIGNDLWLVPASYEERRFLVLSCGAEQQQDYRYFQAISDQLNSGGYEALLHHLLDEVDLSRFNVREAPHTNELREQMMESLRGAEAAYGECLYTGLIPGQVKGDGSARVRTADFVTWARRKEVRWANIKPQHVGLLFGNNPRGKLLGFNFKSESLHYWVIPPLSEARKLWDSFRFKVLWPDDGGEWDKLVDEDLKF